MRIWVDADACPVVVRQILFRAAERTGVQLTLVANQHITIPALHNIDFKQVASGFDVADHAITEGVSAGDLVVTQDIPLAADVMAKGGVALSPRGELFTEDTIRQRVNMRDFMDTMRASGIHTGGPAPLGPRDRQAFANQLDQYLARSRTQ